MLKVIQIAIGRFHHFHLARQLEKHGLLERIWTGYPMFKLKDEVGIPIEKIKTFPWLQAPFMFRGKVGLGNWKWLSKQWAWQAHNTLDAHVARNIKKAGVLFAMSGSGLQSAQKMKSLGGIVICDRGSSHIRFQNTILTEEYARWGFTYQGIDPCVIEKEEAEYALADFIAIPSEYVKQSFLQMGVPEHKLIKIEYGVHLERFKKVSEPAKDTFTVIWVGAVHLQKGFMDALLAFQTLKHPNKEFIVIGHVSPEITQLIENQNLEQVVFKGNVNNTLLPEMYSKAHVFVFPSINDGFGMVQGEALACGCPVIATNHTGASDLFTDGVEGFIVPIRSPQRIAECLQLLADDEALRLKMSAAAIKCVQNLGGWDTYGNKIVEFINKIE